MLIDDVTIHVKAGRGGDGVVRFSRIMMAHGPTGGNGGNGGNVVLKGVSDLGALRPFRTKKNVKASAGEIGAQNNREGAGGDDMIVLVPIGTTAYDLTNQKHYDIVTVGQEVIIARGGNGGFGNFHFRSSRNTTPQRANQGKAGDEVDVRLALKLIADVGFVGYPNVGKSSLLNELTNASSKVANYQFTTLEPHLGVYYDLILADIPGLIKGASEGRGLGYKFLQHVERTRVLFHFVAADSTDPVDDYLTIRGELGAFNEDLLKQDEYVFVSKSDERTPEEVATIITKLKKHNPRVYALSILDPEALVEVKKILTEIADKKQGGSTQT